MPALLASEIYSAVRDLGYLRDDCIFVVCYFIDTGEHVRLYMFVCSVDYVIASNCVPYLFFC